MELARQLLMTVQDAGGDADAILVRAGVAGRGEWRERIDRIPLTQSQFVVIYRECLFVLDIYARIDTGMAPLSKVEFELLCHCIITCATIEDVISRAAAFSAMIQNRAGELNLEIIGDRARFGMKSFRKNYNINAFFVDLTGVASYYRLFSWLIGEDIEPIKIEMCHKQFIDDDIVAQIIACPISYSKPSNVLQFPARYLKYPVVRTPVELAAILKTFPFEPMMPQSREAPISERLLLNFNTALAERKPLPRTAALANQLSIGVTTLKRRLAEEGASVKSIKERCRCELALSLLNDRHLTIGEIASRVGFSDATAFRRAFKGWTGTSPYKFRHAIKLE
jgi:AraC-like DNA-binding protein